MNNPPKKAPGGIVPDNMSHIPKDIEIYRSINGFSPESKSSYRGSISKDRMLYIAINTTNGAAGWQDFLSDERALDYNWSVLYSNTASMFENIGSPFYKYDLDDFIRIWPPQDKNETLKEAKKWQNLLIDD